MCERTLRYLAKQEVSPRMGRPPHSATIRWATMMAAGRQLRRQGWTAGWPAVATALPHAPVGLLKVFVPALKRRHRGKVARLRARHRVTLMVERPGVLLTEDGFQAAGTRTAPVVAELLRDAATMQYVGGSTGGPTRSEDVTGNLEALRITGKLPLVYGSDNGPYKAALVQAYLAAHQVVWFPSRPHTPQDNGGMERAIREVEAEAGDLEDLPPVEVAERLGATTGRLNAYRVRPSRGGFTADELTELMPACDPSVRPRFYAAATAAIAAALAGAKPRQARAAWRQAVIGTMEQFELARRVRGDGAPAPQEAEVLT